MFISPLRRSIIDTHTRSCFDFSDGNSTLLYPQSRLLIGCFTIEFLGYSQPFRQLSRSIQLLIPNPLFNIPKSSNENGRRMFSWPRDNIEHMIHPINHIDIPAPRMSEHRRIAFGLAVPRMTRFIILPVIRFHFRNDIFFVVDHEKFTEKVLTDAHRITIKKRGSEYFGFHRSIIENKKKFTTLKEIIIKSTILQRQMLATR